MIVDSMNYAEVFAELDRDRPNLERWMDRKYDEARRYALKHERKDFPMVLVAEHMSPRRIKYGVMFILRKRDINGNTYMYSYTRRKVPTGGFEVYLCQVQSDSRVPNVVYIPHAIKRYAERTGCDKTGDDLIRHMFISSIECVMNRNQQIGSKSVRYKGDMLIAFCTQEGAWLGKQEGNIFVINTFITYDMMCGKQAEEYGRHRDTFYRGVDIIDDFCVVFNNRQSIRSNQPMTRKIKKLKS